EEQVKLRELSASSSDNSRTNKQLARNVKQLQDDAARNANRIDGVQSQVSDLDLRCQDLVKRNQALEQSNQELIRQILELNKKIEDDKAARQEEMNKLVNVIAEQTTKVINDTVAANTSIPAGAGPFVKYPVESGDSLNIIAKAHKVKIDEIRKANRMKNDSIRAGQVLYIPKKD
ncbi:MAG: LysM peptidoglycan-binding domain-containing protein, partial [Lentisphaerota bacterium]